MGLFAGRLAESRYTRRRQSETASLRHHAPVDAPSQLGLLDGHQVMSSRGGTWYIIAIYRIATTLTLTYSPSNPPTTALQQP